MSFYTIRPEVKEMQISYDTSLIEINPKIQKIYLGDDDLNSDKEIIQRIVHYYYNKAIDKWLYNDFDDLVEFFEVKGGKVKLISNYHHKNYTLDKKYYDAVLKFIENTLLTKKFVKKAIKEYVDLTMVNWYDMYYHSSALKELFLHKLKRRIKKLIKRAK